jgi:1-deoxy-D-xylulose-5-phosphate reductoisomerase
MKTLSILGATGSIGTNALEIVSRFPDRFAVRALCAHTNVDRLARQIVRFNPRVAAVADAEHARRLKDLLPATSKVEIVFGVDGYVEAAARSGADLVLNAMVGAAGLVPTLAAIDAGKDIALANKESLVMAGALVMDRVAACGVKLMPVDSEHSAIFQSLAGHRDNGVREMLLTASGGPFLTRPADTFNAISPEDALNHPNWSMGHKISIDSATLMNKGLEVIEARWLFDVTPDRIEVVVHPQSIVHSMVAYRDGSVVAQLGVPDMRGAIAYALSWPERLPLGLPVPDFSKLGSLTFEPPDLERFPALGLAFRAVRTGGTFPAVLNAANEAAVSAFLDGTLSFPGIARTVEAVMDRHEPLTDPDLEAILAADRWARKTAATMATSQ